MPEIFFTGDTHFLHANIIKHCKRPWLQPGDLDKDGEWINKKTKESRAKQMTTDMIKTWNDTVNKNDTVYHLGDFAFAPLPRINDLIDNLNGNIHLIIGNHDPKYIRKAEFASINPTKEIKIDGQLIILNHYSMRVWNKRHHGSWHLYAHSHGTLAPLGNSRDVGMDANEYKLLHYDDLKEELENPKEINIDMDDDLLLKIAKMAHERDVTINQIAYEAMIKGIENALDMG